MAKSNLSSSSSSLFVITAISSLSLVSLSIILFYKRSNHRHRHNHVQTKSYEECIGQTPLLNLSKTSAKLNKINKTSKNRSIYVKMECFNPGGTSKDRAALFMLQHAERNGDLPPPLSKENNNSKPNQHPTTHTHNITNDNDTNLSLHSTITQAISSSKTGGIVIEGTSGSTGISLATLCTQRGHSIIIVMPNDQSNEKVQILKCLGAIVHIVPTASISNPNHYVNVAKNIANEINTNLDYYDYESQNDKNNIIIKAAFMNQFENEANYNAHYETTGPEIYDQTNGNIDIFCMSAGTGGTISGVGSYLKQQKDLCKIILIDPPGSTLYNKIKYNIAYTTQQKERNLLRHRYDTIAEGIGLDRITHNFSLGYDQNVIDDAIYVSDQEAVDVAHWLLKEEGLFVGSSSAMNVVGAIRSSVMMDDEDEGDNSSISRTCSDRKRICIVTIICDGGQRHLTRFWNREFIIDWGLLWPKDDEKAWNDRLDVIFLSKNKQQ